MMEDLKLSAQQKKRILLIVLDPEAIKGEYYVVTAHTANRKDRTLYQEKRG